jgi:putative membrane protein
MYKVVYETKDSRMSWNQGLIDFFFSLVASTLVLITVSEIFSRFEIANLQTAVIAAFIIAVLNKTVKPFIFIFTLPVTLLTLGLFYPLVNGIILNIVDWILGSSFVISGFWTVFFASVAISLLNMLLSSLVLDKVKSRG